MDGMIAREGLGDALEAIAQQAAEYAALNAAIRAEYPRIGDTRACPDCGRPQHYTGIELGWCHDALIDTWHCADPAQAPVWVRVCDLPGCVMTAPHQHGAE